MSRYFYGYFMVVLFALVWFTIPSASHANTAESQYCISDEDGKLYPGTEGFESVINCNYQSTDISDTVLGLSQKLEITGANCNPSIAGDCRSKNIDYRNFKIYTVFTDPITDSKTNYSFEVEHNDSGDKSVRHGVLLLTLQKQGSRACVIADGELGFPLPGGDVNLLSFVSAETHCLYIPPPEFPYQAPQWSNIVAKVCTDFRESHSKYDINPAGLVVQCVEETMRNIFALKRDGDTVLDAGAAPLFALNDPSDYNRTFFSSVQENLRGLVLAALVLYVTLFGLGVVMSQKIPSKGDFIMAVLKFALVLYFSLGTGIVDFIPRLVDMSKTLSLILMESSENLPINYKYCDFEGAIAAEPYPAGFETMELWDVVDCKLSKYLGFKEGGQDKPNQEIDQIINDAAPKMILIAVMFWGDNFTGILTSIFAIAAVLFIITLTIRIVHVYIIAILSIYFLAFLAPLVIPTALFNYTKDIFDNWLKQLISFSLQPVILFAFLAVVFAISDFVMYRANNQFCADTHSIRMSNQTLGDDGTCTDTEITDDSKPVCHADDNAPACVIFKHINIELWGKTKIPTWFPYGTSSGEILLAFMQLLFVFFVLNALLPTIEELSHRLTDASGGGAVAMAKGTSTQGPASSVSAGLNVAGAAAGNMAGGATGTAARGGSAAYGALRGGSTKSKTGEGEASSSS